MTIKIETPVPDDWQVLANILRRKIVSLTEALSVLPLVVVTGLEHPVQTDGKAIMIDPTLFVATSAAHQDCWFPTQQAAKAFYLLRTCLHLVLRAEQRRGERDVEIWSIAVDNVVNHILTDIFQHEPFDYTSHGAGKFTMLKRVLQSTGRYEVRFYGMTSEEVYAVLAQEATQEASDSSQPDLDESDAEGAQEGSQEPLEIIGNDFGAGVTQESGIADDLGELVNNATKDWLDQHGDLLAAFGDAAAREITQAKVKPPILLKDVLRKIRDVLPGLLWSYRRPSRSDVGVFVKLGKQCRMPSASPNPSDLARELVIAIDASNSQNEQAVRTALAIFHEAFKHTGRGRKIRLLIVTNECYDLGEFSTFDSETATIPFTGGTRLFAIMEWLAEHKVKPSAVILVTDGECSTLDQIRRWNGLHLLRTILIAPSQYARENFPGRVFECDRID